MIEPLQIVAQALWFILPAYAANAVPVVAGGGPPIDGGRKFFDRRRILGDGKTIRGFLFGLLVGSLVGLLQNAVLSRSQVHGGVWIRPGGWGVALLLPLGALLGDIVGSFIKRRVGVGRGEPTPGLDQLDFILGAIFLTSVTWAPSLKIVLTWLLLTPLIHLGTNFVGYKLGLKSGPY